MNTNFNNIFELFEGRINSIQSRPHYLSDINSWHQHIPFAKWLVGVTLPGCLVELGVHKGDSYSAFCQAIVSNKLNTNCVGIDTWEGEEHAGFYEGDQIYKEVFERNECNYGNFSQLLRCTFDQALSSFEDKSIDILHIDGRHKYEDVKYDFESWLVKLKPTGLVLFHDTNVRNGDFGVWKYFEELIYANPGRTFNFKHGNGLGLLLMSGNNNPELNKLCSLSIAERDFVRFAFSIFGEEAERGVDTLHHPISLDDLIDLYLGNQLTNRLLKLQRFTTEFRKLELSSYRSQFQLSCQIQELQVELKRSQEQLVMRDHKISEIQRSFSMRITSPLRLVSAFILAIKLRINSKKSLYEYSRKIKNIYRQNGWSGVVRKINSKLSRE